MKKSKMLQRVAAVLLAGTMMMAMGTTVFAEDGPKEAIITKEITKDANDYAPAATFEFSITPGAAVDAEFDENG